METVLISTKSTQSFIKQDVLETRLAALVQPSSTSGISRSEQLSVVDSYLAERGSKDVLKKAIHFVKPFFLAMSDQMLRDEARRILDGFSAEDHGLAALEHFLLHRQHPEILKSGIVDKVMTYHELQEKREYEQKKHPETSQAFHEREILADIGKAVDSAAEGASIEEREKIMAKNARDHSLASSLLGRIDSDRRAAYLEVLRQRREAKLKETPTPEEQQKQPFFEEDLPFAEALEPAEYTLLKQF